MDSPERRFESKDYGEEHADVFAARYDDGMRAVKVEHVRRRLGDVRGKAILDLGCGIGYIASLCADLRAKVIACDFAEAMVARTRQRYGSRFPLVRASAEAPPFLPQSFHVVLALDLIEHLYHPVQMLRAVRTLLCPGGRLIITTDRRGLQIGTLAEGAAKRLHRVFGSARRQASPEQGSARYRTPLCTHVREYRFGELVQLVTASGLRLTGFDTFPNRAAFGSFGRLVELVGVGPLRRYKWGHCIYEFTRVEWPQEAGSFPA